VTGADVEKLQVNYEPGDVSEPEMTDIDRLDHRRWRFVQVMSFITFMSVLAIGFTSYQQSKDRKTTDTLVTSAQKRACDLAEIRNRYPRQTAQEKAFYAYFENSNTVLDCSNVKKLSK
jgi:hypothetical protein